MSLVLEAAATLPRVAAPALVPGVPELAADIVPAGTIAADAVAALEARALVANSFLAPAFLGAALPVFGAGVSLARVRDAQGRLLALWPFRLTRRLGSPVALGFTHPYAPLGVPLLDRDEAEPALTVLLGAFRTQAVQLPMVPADGTFAATLERAAGAAGLQLSAVATRRRAMLEAAGDPWALMSAGRRKELQRLRRKLAEGATLEHRIATEPAEVEAALAGFLALEAAGWKGRAGTAAARDARLEAFMTTAMTGLAAEGRVELHRLVRDGATVAAGIVLRSGDTAQYWKTAYDEAFARFSPGTLVTLALSAHLAADPAIRAVDSCADPGHPMIEPLWPARLALADVLVAPPGRLAALVRREKLRLAAIATARRWRDRLKAALKRRS